MDELKRQVVEAVFARVKQVDGSDIYNFDEPVTSIQVMPQVEKLKLLLKVKTPNGLRFFEIIVKEAH